VNLPLLFSHAGIFAVGTSEIDGIEDGNWMGDDEGRGVGGEEGEGVGPVDGFDVRHRLQALRQFCCKILNRHTEGLFWTCLHDFCNPFGRVNLPSLSSQECDEGSTEIVGFPVGAVVEGSELGVEVGISVGVAVGIALGDLVGTDDGNADGDMEGIALGDLLGKDDGDDDGDMEGLMLGRLVGKDDGELDGDDDGIAVGAAVGSPVKCEGAKSPS